jgi:hypothetical protein
MNTPDALVADIWRSGPPGHILTITTALFVTTTDSMLFSFALK